VSLPEFPISFRFDRFTRNKYTFGRLAHDVWWQTEVLGYNVKIQDYMVVKGEKLWVNIELFEDGKMVGRKKTEYDFGSGPAINNLPVIYSSAPHDFGCHFTNTRLIPWKWRKWFDNFYWRGMGFYGANIPRRIWQWAAVTGYSQLVARWKDKSV